MRTIILMSGVLLALAALTSCSSEESGADGAENTEAAKVVATQIDPNDKDCATQGLPIALHIQNNADTAVRRIFWRFEVYEKGRSTDLATGEYGRGNPGRMSDYIIEPGETLVICSPAPSLTRDVPSENLEYSVVLDPDL